MTSSVHIPECLKQADALRKEGRWKEAVAKYLEAERVLPKEAGIKHNIGVCYFALNDAVHAIRYAELAIGLNDGAWQSSLLRAKAFSQSGKKDEAIALLVKLVQRFPACAEARLELASLALDELGDATLARRLAQSVRGNPRHVKNARLTELMASLYESGKNAEELSVGIRGFAKEYLARPGIVPNKAGRVSGRRRIGLISPQFSCSPVYFFCIGSLKHLSQEFDLVFLNRGHREDWASREFKALATEWLDVANLSGEALARFIERQRLDVLIDLGGWMDPVGLSAISGKPAGRLYKWVGGQSATTGLKAFDGFFTDRYQSLPEDQPLYSEPLVFLESGYVTYTPPPYMPAPAIADESPVFGVIANPVKISCEFLAFLKNAIESYLRQESENLILRFIDRRYRYPQLRARISAALRMEAPQLQERLHLDFIVPQSHRNYLEEVGKLTAVIDTFPYTGGLTTIEALSLGVPCITRPGRLFCERHSYAHCLYAGMELNTLEEQKNLSGMLHFCHQKCGMQRQRTSLIGKTSARLDHQALAETIAGYL